MGAWIVVIWSWIFVWDNPCAPSSESGLVRLWKFCDPNGVKLCLLRNLSRETKIGRDETALLDFGNPTFPRPSKQTDFSLTYVDISRAAWLIY